MQDNEKPQFVQLLGSLMTAYAKPMPEGIFLTSWWNELSPYPIFAVAKAMLAYKDDEPRFAPVPAAVAKLCKLMDGRPNPEEAWARALEAQDEANTVVWTEEIAQAFHACRNVIESNGMIAARKTFTEIYTKLIASARANMKGAKWVVSLGTDKEGQEAPLLAAVNAGLLPGPNLSVLLPYTPADGAEEQTNAEGLRKVKELMATMEATRKNNEVLRQQANELQRAATAARKAELNKQAAGHE